MAEFKIGRLRYTWRGQWATATFYNRDAVSQFNGKTYVCLNPHTSSNFYSDLNYINPSTGGLEPRWELMIDGKTWKNDWLPATSYALGNIVKYAGVVYVCTTAHTSGSNFDINQWDNYSKSESWQNIWTVSTTYGIGDMVKYGGIVYRCISNHVSAATATDGLELDQASWELVNNGIDYKGDWNAASVRYKKNDIVVNGADLWIATAGHTSAATFDLTKWDIWLPGLDFQTTWSSTGVYQPGDVVMYGGYSYVSIAENNQGNTPSSSSSAWELYTQGYEVQGDWNNTTAYKVGAVVRRGGNVFVAVQDSVNQDPTSYSVTTSYVPAGSSGKTLVVNSSAGIAPGMIVTGSGFHNGQTIVKIGNTVTGGVELILNDAPDTPPESTAIFTIVGLNYVYWQFISTGQEWKRFWTPPSVNPITQAPVGTDYVLRDLVVYGNITYRCIKTHNTLTGIRPDLDTDNQYWAPYLFHARSNAGVTFGDLVTRSGSNNIALPIGETDYILRTVSTLPAWREINVTPRVYYVAPNGQDQAHYGTSVDRPFKTIKYACQIVAAGTENPLSSALLDDNKYFLAAEVYEWMVYQKNNNIAPFTNASVFDEAASKRDTKYIIDAIVYDITRGGNSQTVAATLAYFAYGDSDTFINADTEAAMPYIKASLQYLATLIPLVMNNSAPGTSYQSQNGVGSIVNQAFNLVTGYAPEAGSIAQSVSLLEDILLDALINQSTANVPEPNQKLTATINVKTGNYEEELPIVVPANTAICGDELRGTVVRPANAFYTSTSRSSAVTKKFTLASTTGIVSGMPVQFVGTAFGGITAGTTYYVVTVDTTGITISASVGGQEIVPTTSVGTMSVFGGGALGNMFYVHNGTGLRNMTLTGLAGTVTEPNQYLTRRPTGGSYVSLDPGDGPGDTRTWIYRRSPYVQNVTNFGQGCVGLKIDASLHEGGNKSIVCNDFTQILSDGIGIWCVGDGALCEAVSVFSYYNYSGYFSEDGGRIRATNGNSSYGTYGVIAEGFSQSEVPISGTVDNKSAQVQAQVQSAFGSTAELVKVQYSNAGNHYVTETTNLIKYSNNFLNGVWSTDNLTLQQNLTAPLVGDSIAWQATASTSSTDNSYIYQNQTILPTGATYNAKSGTNVSGSGIGATFNVTVTSTGYVVTVNTGGTGYVINNQILIPGIELGGVSGVHDCTITITALSGSTVTAVSSAGTVPSGATTFYTLSIFCKKGTSPLFDLYSFFTGSSTKGSGISFNFDTETVTAFGADGGGNVPTNYGKVTLTNGWYRIWFVISDASGLNSNLQLRAYPRGRTGNAGYSYIFGAQINVGTDLTFYQATQNTRYRSHADYYISGAGTGVETIGDEIRFGSTFEGRIISGGSGYLTSSNNAQGGNQSYVIIAGSDENTPANYVNMRMFINSGTGAGQYGYISAYDTVTKEVRVLKESFAPLTITSTASSTNSFVLGAGQVTGTLYPNMPVQFIPTYYNTTVTATSTGTTTVTNTTGGTVNTMQIPDTGILYVNMPITFSGTTFGGVTSLFTYYVKEIINNVEFTISTQLSGNIWPLNTAAGSMTLIYPSGTGYLTGSTSNMSINMAIRFTGSVFGNILANTEYYVNNILTSSTFTISTALVSVTATVATTGTDELTVDTTTTLTPCNPIIFTGTSFGGVVADTTYYVSSIVNGTKMTLASNLVTTNITATQATTNLITCTSTTGFVANKPIIFTGNGFGNIVAENVYYILAVNDSSTFTISGTPGGSSINLTDAVGFMSLRTPGTTVTLSNATGTLTGTTTSAKTLVTQAQGTMTGTYSTPLFGGVTAGTDYYVLGTTSNTFTVAATNGGLTPITLSDKSGSMRVAAAGWDHINPGTPIQSLLDSTTVYFIEPRLEFTAPSFAATGGGSTTTLSPGTSWVDLAYGNHYWMALPSDNAGASRSDDGGLTWNGITFPITAAWTGLAYGNNYWVAISSGGGGANSQAIYSSANGEGWTAVNLPANTSYSHIVYGNGLFVVIAAGTANSAYSSNFGGTWTAGSGLPAATWTGLCYGAGKYVAVSSGGTVAAYSTDGINWLSSTLPQSTTWADVAYGNGRFVAVSSSGTTTAYSFNGINWFSSNLSVAATKIGYGQGTFVAISSASTTAYISEDGINWSTQSVPSNAYGAIQFGYTDTNEGVFVAVSGTTSSTRIKAGTTTKGRPLITSGRLQGLSIWEPGSNYTTAPTLTFNDPNITAPADVQVRIGDGALANPTFVNRGAGYSTTSTSIKVTGDGYGDTYQLGYTLILDNLTKLPSPGDNLSIAGNSITYKVTNATAVYGTVAPSIKANIQIAPELTVSNSPVHGAAVSIRTKYSQVRLTNHDFLSIGYGDEVETNYPAVPTETVLAPQDQVVETNNGRVFYTSTDQDGNFKVGSLFAVEQATGIITISATQFGLQGLETLSLGGIAVGGSSTVITQFSTDPTFVANSNAIIPTQKAIKSYLTSRLSQGGSNTFTGQLTAGTVVVGGPDKITSTLPNGTTGSSIKIPVTANFKGSLAAWDGDGLAYNFFVSNWVRPGAL